MPDLSTKIRFARPTNRLEEVLHFYRDGLGFEVLSSFQDHAGFDGVMLGLREAAYHLEFTQEKGHVVADAPTQDHLLVFYLPDNMQWLEAIRRLQGIGCEPIKSYNPYWDVCGKTFQDPDGYRVVLQNAEWSS